jgi:dolichol-phosphate mannosyltransferase
MAKLIKELSVFFPTYNEEKNIGKVVRDAKKVLEKIAGKWEITIVEDGSKDTTPQVADKIAKLDKRIRVIHHKPNRGYGGALKTGFSKAKYKWVAFTDSDGQFDFSEIVKFIKKQNETGADLVLGIRTNRADPAIRKLFTFVWSKLLPGLLLGLKVTDYSCGFKMIRKNVYASVQPLVGEEKVTQIEMLTKAQRSGFKFAEVGVKHYPRKFGHQTGADFKVIAKSIQDLLKLWRQLR